MMRVFCLASLAASAVAFQGPAARVSSRSAVSMAAKKAAPKKAAKAGAADYGVIGGMCQQIIPRQP